MNPLVARTLQVARGEVGVREVPRGSNRGARVQAYQRAAGYGPGVAWCACFVFWGCEQASNSLKAPNPWIKTGWCPDIHNWAKREGILFQKPAAGDVFLVYGTVRGVFRANHTGFVLGIEGSRFRTIEGNTSGGGSREGDGVYERTRPITSTYKFVRWERVVPALQVPVFTWVQNGKKVAELPLQQNRALVGIRRFGEALGFAVDWNAELQCPVYNGKIVAVQVGRVDGEVVASFRELAQAVGLGVKVDGPGRRVTLVRPEKK